ncbi:AMIN domain-containing protein [bacterium]|nr:AMIN domain-containing protein [bacterium]
MQRFLKFTLILFALIIIPISSLPASDSVGEINGLRIKEVNGDLRIEINKVGNVNFDLFLVKDPSRLVVDCIGAEYHLSKSLYQTESPLIYRVRTSQFKTDPVPVSRLVLDLRKDVNHRIFEDKDKQILLLSDSNGGDSGGASLIGTEVKAVNKEAEAKDKTEIEKAWSSAAAAAMGSYIPLENVLKGDGQEVVAVSDASNARAEIHDLPEIESKNEDETQPLIEKAPLKEKESDSPADKTKNIEVNKEIKADNKKITRAWQKVDSPWVDEGDAGNNNTDKGTSQQNRVVEEQPVISVPVSDNETGYYNSGSFIRDDNLPWSNSYVRGAPASGTGIPMGSRRITVDAQGADIKTVLQTISEFANVNIVAGADVKGDVYVHVRDCPWQEALEIILKAHGYGYREEYGMIRVAENKRLLREELDQKTAERKKEDLLPIETKIIPINNSNAEEIGDALKNVVSKRGEIDVDLGSNTLIVNDIEQNLAKIMEIVKKLDTKHMQVEINAKLIEIDVEAKRELGIKWDFLNLHKTNINAIGSASVDQGIPLSSGVLKVGTVQSWGELNSVIQALEEENKANIISNPRITTMDNREASILVGKEIPLIVADEAGNPLTELTKIGIMLRVIPHVNTDNTITLDLHPEVSELQTESTQQGGVIISTSEADTRVQVANGETAIIGGLIKQIETEVRTGVPFLKDIPFLGGLFSSSSKVKKKQELVIFVTPTIVE